MGQLPDMMVTTYGKPSVKYYDLSVTNDQNVLSNSLKLAVIDSKCHAQSGSVYVLKVKTFASLSMSLK